MPKVALRGFGRAIAKVREQLERSQPGLALWIDTPICTVWDGWKTMATIQQGDQVFSETGYPCNVIAKSDVLSDRRCFKLVFSCGSGIIADADHNWLTFSDAEQSLEVRRTEEIHRTLKHAYGTPSHWIECPSVCHDRRAGDRVFRSSGFKRYILDAIKVDSVPVCCIQVDSPSSLFLVGESMIPTHNSLLLSHAQN